MATLPKKVFRLKAKELRKQVTTLEDTGFVEDLRADDQSGGLIPGMGSLTDGPELLVDIIDGIINDITGLVDPYAAIELVTEIIASNNLAPVDTIDINAGVGDQTVEIKSNLAGLNDILKQGSIKTAMTVDQVLKAFVNQDPKIYEVLTEFATKDRLDYLRSEYIATISVNTGESTVNFSGSGVENVKGSLALISELTGNKFIYELSDIGALRSLAGNFARNTSFFGLAGVATETMEKAFNFEAFNYKALFSEIMKNAIATSDTGLMLEMAIYLNQKDEGVDRTTGRTYKVATTTKTLSKRALLPTMYSYMKNFFANYGLVNTTPAQSLTAGGDGYYLAGKMTFTESIVEYIRIEAIMRLCRPVPDEINTNISIRQDYPSSPVGLKTAAFYPLGWAFRIAAEVKNDEQASSYLSLLNSNDPLPNTAISQIEKSRLSFLEFISENKLNMSDWRFLYKKSLFPNVTNWLDLMEAAYQRGLRVEGETFVFDWKAYLDEYYDAIVGDWKISAISKQYRAMIASAVTKLTVADLVSSALVEGPFYSHNYFLEKGVVTDIYKNITNKGILQIFANYAKFSRERLIGSNLDVSDTLSASDIAKTMPATLNIETNFKDSGFLDAQSNVMNNILKSYPLLGLYNFRPEFAQYGQYYYVDSKGKTVYPQL